MHRFVTGELLIDLFHESINYLGFADIAKRP